MIFYGLFKPTFFKAFKLTNVLNFQNPWRDLGTINFQFNLGINTSNILGAIVLIKV